MGASSLRPDLRAIVDRLLAQSATGGAIALDDVGDALGTTAASYDEIDAMLHALEAAGRRVSGPEGAKGERTLRTVLDDARAFRAETGRAPTAPQIAERTGLDVERVRHALALARVISK